MATNPKTMESFAGGGGILCKAFCRPLSSRSWAITPEIHAEHHEKAGIGFSRQQNHDSCDRKTYMRPRSCYLAIVW